MEQAAKTSLRSLLEAVSTGRLVSLPVLVAVNEKASMSIGRDDLSGVTRGEDSLKATNWNAEAVARLADNLCVVVEQARPTPGDEMRLLIGRSNRCDYRIADQSVSGVHAIMGVDSETFGYYICHAESRNGTFLEGRRLRPDDRATLWSGAIIGFGMAVFCFLDPPTLRKLSSLVKDQT